ncbi:MAG: hypothetical protein JWM13_2769 [Arthrobacter sp.]|jgi:hypothetical protein|nr:hypothetical protein [Arthrobacter sp.]MCU1555283.1 hypothetical protein [Arthrobacter sp.]
MRGMTISRSAATKTLTTLAALLLAGSLAGCNAASTAGTAVADAVQSAAAEATTAPAAPGAPAAQAPAANPGETAAAVTALATIEVKGRAPKTGYSRDEFGPSWSDTDRNGCDQRNDILARDLTAETLEPNNCVVLTGTLADKYTGKTISFVRGNKTSTLVQIDHIVPLSDAWQKGAQQISAEQRKQLANDPLNLMAADGPTNGSKGDKDAATWLPPNKAFRCEYVARQTAVKAKYKLWMTQAEHDAIAGILAGCK